MPLSSSSTRNYCSELHYHRLVLLILEIHINEIIKYELLG